jgi:hypothetical protein
LATTRQQRRAPAIRHCCAWEFSSGKPQRRTPRVQSRRAQAWCGRFRKPSSVSEMSFNGPVAACNRWLTRAPAAAAESVNTCASQSNMQLQAPRVQWRSVREVVCKEFWWSVLAWKLMCRIHSEVSIALPLLTRWITSVGDVAACHRRNPRGSASKTGTCAKESDMRPTTPLVAWRSTAQLVSEVLRYSALGCKLM